MKQTLLVVLGLFVLALAIRLPDLGASCNVDGILYWFGRTRKFWAALAAGKLDQTYYSPHPGVTLMWLSGASMKLLGVTGRVDEEAIRAATLPVALLSSCVPSLSYLLLRRLLPGEMVRSPYWSVPLVASFLLATEPFLVAHSRTYQMDALVTGFLWLGALLGILTVFERRPSFAALAGLCLGLAMLTRMVTGVFAVTLVAPFLVGFVLEKPKTRSLPVLLAVMATTAGLVVYFGWPAMMVDPVGTASRIVRQSSRLVDKGHATFSWGRAHATDPGVAFYAGVLLMRLTPEVLLSALAIPFLARRLTRRTALVLVSIVGVYLPFTLAVLFSNKKGDRYLLVAFPVLVLMASIAAAELASWVTARGRASQRLGATVIAAVVLFRLHRLVLVHPLPITWCASYPGLRCEDVIRLGQGEGFRDVGRWIAQHSKLRRPAVLSAYSKGSVMRPWLDFVRPETGASAHFVVTYIGTDQRQQDQGILAFAVGDPLHEIRYDGRVYSRIYRGPRYEEARKRPRGGQAARRQGE
jgi:hypothetical protein